MTQSTRSQIAVRMSKLVILTAMLIGLVEMSLAGESAVTSASKEWTEIQRDVWRTVENYSEVSHNRDFEGYLRFWHPEFLGWHNGDTHPTNYAERSRGLEYYFAATKSLEYELEPLGIQIIGDGAAIVHYKLRNVVESIETGKKSPGLSYWTDYLTLEKGKWLLVSDHGGSVPAEDE